MCLSKTIEVICIKQHLINIWSSIHEKVKQHWGWVEKSVACKKACISRDPQDIYKKHFDDLLIFFRLLFQKMSFQNPRFKNFFLETITDWLWQLQHHIGEKAFLLSSSTYFFLCFVFVQAFFISISFFWLVLDCYLLLKSIVSLRHAIFCILFSKFTSLWCLIYLIYFSITILILHDNN